MSARPVVCSLATLGRGSTFALGAVFAWMAFGENLVRGVKPLLQHLLVGENLAITLTGAQLEGTEIPCFRCCSQGRRCSSTWAWW